jgi:hypothetical protein
MNNFEQNRRKVLEVCIKELLKRKVKNNKLKELING